MTKVRTIYSGSGFNLLIFVLLILSSIRRFPPNLFEANFFAEDGIVFWKNIHEHGVLAIMTPFNNQYPIVGLYLITMVSEFVRMIFGASVFHAATFLNISGFLVWASFCFAPLVLLKDYLGRFRRILLAFMMVFVPLDNYDFAILGTVGNLKAGFFALGCIVFLFAMKQSEVKPIAVALFGILLCSATNPYVYLLIPVLIFHKVQILKKSFWFYIFNGVALSSIFYQAYLLRSGIPELKGNLDEPYIWSNSIKVVARALIYPYTHPFHHLLNDFFSIFLIATYVFLVIFVSGKSRILVIQLLGFWSLSLVILLSQRSGLSEFFFAYDYLAPSQFFYVFNWMSIVILFIATAQIQLPSAGKNRLVKSMVPSLLLLIQLLPVPGVSSFGGNNSMHINLKSFYYNISRICEVGEENQPIQIYPFVELKLALAVNDLCKA